MGVMTFGRGAAAHMMIDLDKFACNLKSKHDAAVSRRFAPELCILTSPSIVRGLQETGCRLAQAVHCAKIARQEAAQRHTGEAKHPAFPARGGLTAYAVLFPGSDALLPPSLCGWLMCDTPL
jgi:hypothetical protein